MKWRYSPRPKYYLDHLVKIEVRRCHRSCRARQNLEANFEVLQRAGDLRENVDVALSISRIIVN